MKRKRTDFTKKQKADIFARDRGTCAFSGISVWLFDYGIRPNYEIDWADHIIPSAKGGLSELSNGICASSFYNAKKKDNGSDNQFLFHNGRVTKTYIHVHGKASDEHISDLRRRRHLTALDWFVNRAAANTYYAFDWRCELNFNSKEYKRDDEHYYKVAFNMLYNKIKDQEYESIELRGMINPTRPFGVDRLLELETVGTLEQYREWAESIWPLYQYNWEAYNAFLQESCSLARSCLLQQFSESKNANPDLVIGLTQLLDDVQGQERTAA